MALVAKFSAHHYFFDFAKTMVVWAQWLGAFWILMFAVRARLAGGEARSMKRKDKLLVGVFKSTGTPRC
jgi:hypothetical protein